jgi:hypothetical protein
MFSQLIRLYIEMFLHANRYRSAIISTELFVVFVVGQGKHSWEVRHCVVTEQLAGLLSKIVYAQSECGCCPENIR